MTTVPTRVVLGTSIAALTLPEALALADEAIRGRRPLLVGVVNAAKLVNMRRDAALRDAVRKSDVIFADGMSVVWASWLLGQPLPERVTGIDLMEAMLTQANERGRSVFLLGAAQDVLDAVQARIRADLPHVRIAGSQHGYFAAEDEPRVVESIARAAPDILLVAMSSPRKECFLARWHRRLNVRVAHGVGGAFDVYAGRTRRAPRLLQRAGLEWAYRVLQEPGRLWKRYFITNVQFALLIAQAMFSRLWRGGNRPQGVTP